MINSQLETNINKEKMLKDLISNLNINQINDSSNLRKITDVYYNEATDFSSIMDSAVRSGFLSTMSDDLLEAFGRQYNVQRRRYNDINIYDRQMVVTLQIDRDAALVTELNGPTLLVEKGAILFNNNSVTITSLKDIYVSNINETPYISIKFNIDRSLSSYIIESDTVYSTKLVSTGIKSIIPKLSIKFHKPIGLSQLEESVSDYRARLIEATYMANNGANSLLSSVLKEVPLVYYLETEDYINGKGISNIYPYTDVLINEGYDSRIRSYMIPMLEANLRNKIMYGQLINIEEPEPLLLKLELDFTKVRDKQLPTESYLDNIKYHFNQFFYRNKLVDKDSFVSFLFRYFSDYKLKNVDYNFIFTSPHVSEETFNMDKIGLEYLKIDTGRFLHLTAITLNTI